MRTEVFSISSLHVRLFRTENGELLCPTPERCDVRLGSPVPGASPFLVDFADDTPDGGRRDEAPLS